ncbi:MAG: hypothetical protein U1E86_07705 [Burkholderiaceae bacterium]
MTPRVLPGPMRRRRRPPIMVLRLEIRRLAALIESGAGVPASEPACGAIDGRRLDGPALADLLAMVWSTRRDTVWTVRDLVRAKTVSGDQAVTRALGYALSREADTGERVERAGRSNDGNIWRLRW